MSVEIFADVGMLVQLLSDTDDDRAVGLLCYVDDLIAGSVFLQTFPVSLNLLAIVSELRILVEPAILFLHKYKRLENTACFDALHANTSLRRRPFRQKDAAQNAERCAQAGACDFAAAAQNHADVHSRGNNCYITIISQFSDFCKRQDPKFFL